MKLNLQFSPSFIMISFPLSSPYVYLSFQVELPDQNDSVEFVSLSELNEPGVGEIEGAKGFEWTALHSLTSCDICGISITLGDLVYHCNECANFDLCSDCQKQNMLSHSHPHELTECISASSYPPPSTSTVPVTTTRLRVSNLSFRTTAETVGRKFEEYGEIIEAMISSEDNRSLGYGFVIMRTVEEAKRAQSALNNTELDGHKIIVEGA